MCVKKGEQYQHTCLVQQRQLIFGIMCKIQLMVMEASRVALNQYNSFCVCVCVCVCTYIAQMESTAGFLFG